MATALVEAGAVTADATGSVLLERADAPGPEPLDPAGAQPLALGLTVRALPPFDVDPERGEVRGPVGALEHVAEGVRALARVLGDRAVALVQFATADEETPFALSARQDEGIVVVVGDEQYEMAPGWPPPR
jgi:hypothetical protein